MMQQFGVCTKKSLKRALERMFPRFYSHIGICVCIYAHKKLLFTVSKTWEHSKLSCWMKSRIIIYTQGTSIQCKNRHEF